MEAAAANPKLKTERPNNQLAGNQVHGKEN